MIARIKRAPTIDLQRIEPLYLTDCPCCGKHLGWRLHRIQPITCRFCGRHFVAEGSPEKEKTS